MLLLLFSVKKNLYALDSSQVIEVIPKVALKEIPHVPEYVTGVFNYHGVIVPVINLCKLIHEESCAELLGTRIILINYPGKNNNNHILGLLAERVTETLKVTENDFVPSGINTEEAPYLGEITNENQEMIQIVHVQKLLPDSLKKNLFIDQTRNT